MSVYDRWHKSHPKPGEAKCKCRPSKVATADHGKGMRWQVRWRDHSGKPQKLNFERLPDAQRKDAEIKASLNRGDYIDPRAGKITVRQYGEQWLAAQTFDRSTYELVELRLRLHVYPNLGDSELRDLRPSMIQTFSRALQIKLAPNYARAVFYHLSALLNAAVDDGLISKNPCQAGSVRSPRFEIKRISPWTIDEVGSVAEAITRRYRAMVLAAAGLGLRQGEAFGLAVDDIDYDRQVVHVRRQVKLLSRGRVRAFAPPKGGKLRDVPLPEAVAEQLRDHIKGYEPTKISLPWKTVDGGSHTAELVFVTRQHTPIARKEFNLYVWKAALRRAGIATTRENGFHMLRHHFASVLLEAGVSIKAVAEFLGHADPGFTLRTYTHLMSSSEDRMREAIEKAWSALEVP
jgi:integrase